MRNLLALLLLLSAGPAAANPMLEKCLPFAPEACALTEKSGADDFLACFGTKKLVETGKGEGACGEELAHARVHKACDAEDIPRVCDGVKPGGNRVMGCLREHAEVLSLDCRKALKSYDALTRPGGARKRGRGNAVGAVRC